ncbi:SGNH hydrolase domain-containing protein [Shewanella phaeophyticola]|uniref:SGNH hydrolase domain-containing protein n=1 Tax=Shewanella phaeophyticola TaxID=2978345 RepID=A0ABT2P331_9GAMM|nr:SGNH hydrolase domain-containing protein [Shewanella sp. KJ10-1]MCT8987047.1 SGNH hydrolase domain-containing protein [Shewanella sp. KJ10-1]
MKFFLLVFFSLVTIVTCGLFSDGFSNRFTDKENLIFNSIYEGTNERNCLAADRDATRGLLERCTYGGNGSKILLLGDSHANHLNEFLLNLKDEQALQPRIAEFTQGACNPILDFPYSISSSKEHATACFIKNSKTLDIVSEFKPDLIVLSARWPRSSTVHTLINGKLEVVDISEFTLKFEQTLKQLLSLNVNVVVFNDVAGTGDVGYNCPIKKILLKDDRTCQIKEPNYDKWFVSLNSQLSSTLKYKFINLNDFICIDGFCETENVGFPLYKDAAI